MVESMVSVGGEAYSCTFDIWGSDTALVLCNVFSSVVTFLKLIMCLYSSSTALDWVSGLLTSLVRLVVSSANLRISKEAPHLLLYKES